MDVNMTLLLTVLRDTLAATVNFIMFSSGNQAEVVLDDHLGDTAIGVDVAAHAIFQANLLAHPGTATLDVYPEVVGEENPVAPTDMVIGQLLILLDPADGSNQWRCQRAEWCTAGVVLMKADEAESASGWRFVTAFAAAPDGRVFLMREPGEVVIGSIHNAIMTPFWHPSAPNPTKEHIVAANAYKAAARHLANPVFDALGDQWFAVTFAGNPAVLNMLNYDTDACFNLNPSSVWDTAAVMIAANTSAVVGSIDGHRWSYDELIALFSSRLDLAPATCQFVPPYVAAKNEALFDDVVGAIRAAGLTIAPR